MREAITSSIVVVYLVLLSWTAFIPLSGKQSDISRALVSNFTWAVSVVIAFYFGVQALEVAARSRKPARPPSPDDHDPAA